MAGLLQGLGEFATRFNNPELPAQMENERLVDQLTRQREQDTEWKRQQTAILEKMHERGEITTPVMFDYLNQTWADHKGNKQLLGEKQEHLDALHRALGFLGLSKGAQNPNPQGTGTMSAPPTIPITEKQSATPTVDRPSPAIPTQPTTQPTPQLSMRQPFQFMPPPAMSQVPPSQGAPPLLSPMNNMSKVRQVGDVVNINGKGQHKITRVNPDGSFEADPAGM